MAVVDPSTLLDLRIGGLLVVFGLASYYDWKSREVRDELWLLGGLVGGALLFLGVDLSDPVWDALYVLLIIFVIQHFIPWDARLQQEPVLVTVIEGTLYAAVIILAAASYFWLQPPPPIEFYVVIVAVLIARALFESGLLYGGADAKALMAAAILVPLTPSPLAITLPVSLQSPVLGYIPFAFTMLVDGAVLTLVAPLVVLAYNLSKGERQIPRIFHMYRIPTAELPRRFVWLKDPPPPPHPREETTAEDEEIRTRQARELLEKGITEVWVTPQVPFLISLAGGAVLGVLVGDVLLWLIATLS
jgi:prepilin signal peptidase PulO-like enzyme (type II secretory pathway)